VSMRPRLRTQLVDRVRGCPQHRQHVGALIDQRLPHRSSEVRTFTTTTGGVLALRDCLTAAEVSVAGMESTGDYWKCGYYLLDEDGFDLPAARCPKHPQCAGQQDRRHRRLDRPIGRALAAEATSSSRRGAAAKLHRSARTTIRHDELEH
jgi:hypothetical protein